MIARIRRTLRLLVCLLVVLGLVPGASELRREPGARLPRRAPPAQRGARPRERRRGLRRRLRRARLHPARPRLRVLRLDPGPARRPAPRRSAPPARDARRRPPRRRLQPRSAVPRHRPTAPPSHRLTTGRDPDAARPGPRRRASVRGRRAVRRARAAHASSSGIPMFPRPLLRAWALAACLWPAAASADPLTADDVVRYALDHHPDAVAASAAVDVATGERRKAAVFLANPRSGVGVVVGERTGAEVLQPLSLTGEGWHARGPPRSRATPPRRRTGERRSSSRPRRATAWVRAVLAVRRARSPRRRSSSRASSAPRPTPASGSARARSSRAGSPGSRRPRRSATR